MLKGLQYKAKFSAYYALLKNMLQLSGDSVVGIGGAILLVDATGRA